MGLLNLLERLFCPAEEGDAAAGTFFGPRPRLPPYGIPGEAMGSLAAWIQADLAAGHLSFKRWTEPTVISRDEHAESECGRIRARLDHANIGGTFSFLWLDGKEVRGTVDRVVDTIMTGTDPGERERSLWRC
jgi:hypothetical protein